MVCRAPTSAATCTGSSPTGQSLTYDHEGQLIGWRSQPGPTGNLASFAYDGEGSRVALQTNTSSGITTTTDYLLGGLEEQQTVGGSLQPRTTLTEYYPIPGVGTAVRVSTSTTSTLSYLASDGLGSVSVALSTTGTATASALYAPYGTVRYASGQMPTAHGYTGQLADAMTGLDDYGARYYDPALGQFTQADTVLDGLNRYAYVGGNPESATDPSGNMVQEGTEDAEGLALVDEGLNPTAYRDIAEALRNAEQTFTVSGVSLDVIAMPDGSLYVFAYGGNDNLIGGYSVADLGQFTQQFQATAGNPKLDWQQVDGPAPGVTASAIRDAEGRFRRAHWPIIVNGPGHGPEPSTTPSESGWGSGEGDSSTASSDVEPATSTDGATSGGGSCCGCGCGGPVNSKGIPYPTVIDPRTGQAIPFPSDPLWAVDPAYRAQYDGRGDKRLFIKDWYDRGYSDLSGPWTALELHHILPRVFGGGNDFWNLVPLSHEDHLQFTNWWKPYCP